MWEGICLDVWGKLPRGGVGPHHRVIRHLLDGGHVAAGLWDHALGPRPRRCSFGWGSS